MPTTNVPLDAATFLAAQGLSLTLGTNLFAGPPREPSAQIPKNAVFVMATSGGAPPSRVMGQSFEVRSATLHIRVRWSRFEEGDTKARDIADALQGADVSGYLDIEPNLSEPSPEPRDTEGLYYWGLFFVFKYQQGP